MRFRRKADADPARGELTHLTELGLNMTTVSFTPSPRCPEPLVEVLDERFLKLRLFSGTVEQIATGLRWAEGPVWFGDGRYLLVSDIPNNRIVRWDEGSGAVSDFRNPSNNANGNFRDRQGRLITCEHLTRRVTRTEYDGSITVLADRFEGKRLNSPNDLVCARDGSIWFTDPPFGIAGHWEGEPAEMELPHAVYCLAPDGTAIGHIHLPERCANVCFGGRHRNRLFMAATHSVYALYVNTQGA